MNTETVTRKKPGRVPRVIKIGTKFDKWTFLGDVQPVGGNSNHKTCLCKCNCGTTKRVYYYNLITHRTKSCRVCSLKKIWRTHRKAQRKSRKRA